MERGVLREFFLGYGSGNVVLASTPAAVSIYGGDVYSVR